MQFLDQGRRRLRQPKVLPSSASRRWYPGNRGFDVTNWPQQLGVRATLLSEAMRETFQRPIYSQVMLVYFGYYV